MVITRRVSDCKLDGRASKRKRNESRRSSYLEKKNQQTKPKTSVSNISYDSAPVLAYPNEISKKVLQNYNVSNSVSNLPDFNQFKRKRNFVSSLFHAQCRICGIKNIRCCKIFEKGVQISQIVNTFLPIKVSENDKLPTDICLECLGTLQTMDDLAFRSYLVETCLRHNYLSSIKTTSKNQIVGNNSSILCNIKKSPKILGYLNPLHEKSTMKNTEGNKDFVSILQNSTHFHEVESEKINDSNIKKPVARVSSDDGCENSGSLKSASIFNEISDLKVLKNRAKISELLQMINPRENCGKEKPFYTKMRFAIKLLLIQPKESMKMLEEKKEDNKLNVGSKSSGSEIVSVMYDVYYEQADNLFIPHYFKIIEDNFRGDIKKRIFSTIEVMLKKEKIQILIKLGLLKKESKFSSKEYPIAHFNADSPSLHLKNEVLLQHNVSCFRCSSVISKEDLSLHIQESHMVQCKICDRWQTSEDALFNHECQIHFKDFTMCAICEKKLDSSKSVVSCCHSFACKICSNKFENWMSYLEHEKQHYSFINSFKSIFKNQNNLLEDINKSSHGINSSVYSCHICEKECSSLSEVRDCNHSFFCNMCNVLFNNHNLFTKHACNKIKTDGQEVNKTVFSCVICDTEYNSESIYRTHFQECFKTLAEKNGVMNIVLPHLDTYPMRCVYCKDSFRIFDRFYNHFHACQSKSKPEAEIFNESSAESQPRIQNGVFSGKSSFDSSKAIVEFNSKMYQEKEEGCKSTSVLSCKPSLKSSDKTLESTSAIYSCYLCGRRFARFSFLDSHFKFAHAEKDKTCPVCQKVLEQGSLAFVLKHRNSHKNEELESASFGSTTVSNFRCQNCNSYFVNKVHKLFHDLHHHKKPTHKCTLHKSEHTSYDLIKKHEAICSVREESFLKQCAVCSQHFTSLKNYRQHILSHQKSFVCDLCQAPFFSKKLFDNHLKENHSENLHSCKYCEKVFSLETSLVKHCQIFHSDSVFNCEYCGKNFRSETALAAHTTVRSNAKPFNCCFCCKKFRLKSDCISHEELHASTEKYKCELCSGLYSKPVELYCHKRKEHPETFAFQCDSCGCGYNNQAVFEKHILTCKEGKTTVEYSHESISRPPWKNETFDRVFSKRAKLLKHEIRHSRSKVFVCKHCGESFPGVDKLYLHRRTKHADQFIYHCKICMQVYNSRKHYLIHTQLCKTAGRSLLPYSNSDGTKTEFDNYKCSYCEVEYQSKTKLLAHERTHHKKELILKCMICNQVFPKLSVLRDHMEQHFMNNEIKELFCAQCDVALSSEHDLKMHKCPDDGPTTDTSFSESSQTVSYVKDVELEENCSLTQEIITLGPADFQAAEDGDNESSSLKIEQHSNSAPKNLEKKDNGSASIAMILTSRKDEKSSVNFDEAHDCETSDDGNAVENQFIMEEEFIEEIEETPPEVILNTHQDAQSIDPMDYADEASVVYQCSFCGNEFSDISILKSHLKSSHDLVLEQLEFHFLS